MADEATTQGTSAAIAEAPPPEASTPAAPEMDAGPDRSDAKAFTEKLDVEIGDLWARIEKPAPDAPAPAEAPPADPEPIKAEAPKPEEAPPAKSTAEIEREAEDRARKRIEDEQRIQQDADRRVRAQQEHRQQYEAYVGPDSDYQAVNLALRDAMRGDVAALSDLDVVLPNGKKVSEIKGSKGLTEEEAANLLTAWDTARRFEDVMGDRKVRRLVELWNDAIVSSRVLDHPDVDGSAVTRHEQPHDQMAALRDSVIERVTGRLTAQHTEVVKAKDAEIKRLSDRVESLVTERGNLTSQRQAAESASPDRPGQPGAGPRGVPRSADEVRSMSTEEFFRTGTGDALLSRIGNPHQPRRGGRRIA